MLFLLELRIRGLTRPLTWDMVAVFFGRAANWYELHASWKERFLLLLRRSGEAEWYWGEVVDLIPPSSFWISRTSVGREKRLPEDSRKWRRFQIMSCIFTSWLPTLYLVLLRFANLHFWDLIFTKIDLEIVYSLKWLSLPHSKSVLSIHLKIRYHVFNVSSIFKTILTVL